jgi:glutamate-1-semialdehyde aminotransferase/predicted dehydrogenase
MVAQTRQRIPGAEAWPSRVFGSDNPFPAYIASAKGGRCWDIDGNEYVDLLMGYGPVLLGYADPVVDRAVTAQIRHGTLFSLENTLQHQLAEIIQQRLPSAEMAMFFKTGSDATTAALRIARRYTGRRRVAYCGYHGWHDWRFAAADYVPDHLTDQVWPFAAWDPPTLRQVLGACLRQFAAVIVAPEAVVPFDRALFDALAAVTRQHGALLVLDEIKTAARTPPWTAQQHLGITADLTTLSKGIGNGYAISAVVGRREVMSAAEGVHLLGTYHGEATGLAAAMATITELDKRGTREHIWSLGEELIGGLRQLIGSHGIAAEVLSVPIPSMPQLFFRYRHPGMNEHLSGVFFREAIRRGVLLHPRHMWFICGSHTRADIDRVLSSVDKAFAATRRAAQAFEAPDDSVAIGETGERRRRSRAPRRYRAAFIGCGARARMHAAAYGHVSRASIVACADVNTEALEAFSSAFNIDKRYADAAAMMRNEEPDLVHVITPPETRRSLLAAAAECRVPLVIVEKPIAVDVSDHQAILALAAGSGTKFIGNHQLRYHQSVRQLLEQVQAGRIGMVRHIDASARLSLAEQGSHLIDLAVAFNADVPIATAFGSVSATVGKQPMWAAIQSSLSELTFMNGVRVTLACGANAPRTSADEREYRHKRIAVYGTRGYVQWQMNRWECFTESDGFAAGQVDYGVDDVIAEAALIDDALNVLESEQATHPTRLEVALAVNGAILGCYASTLTGTMIELPFNGTDDLLPKVAGSTLMGSLFA